ncbi:unnamed protein product [Protopolystoma xenopodis]|uniref:Uncharacterized protein n=1 Tax=Protopolystoma xenopodis TaxID=117903 RepID=A0A448XSX2_9PLAT|nr:unnamed protein product [Protopolystoma xenopodis]
MHLVLKGLPQKREMGHIDPSGPVVFRWPDLKETCLYCITFRAITTPISSFVIPFSLFLFIYLRLFLFVQWPGLRFAGQATRGQRVSSIRLFFFSPPLLCPYFHLSSLRIGYPLAFLDVYLYPPPFFSSTTPSKDKQIVKRRGFPPPPATVTLRFTLVPAAYLTVPALKLGVKSVFGLIA